MIEFINNFHFIRPYFLLFLLLPLLLFFRKITPSKTVSSWEDICDKNLLNFLLVKGSSERTIYIKKYIYIGLISAIIAAAGPSWKKIELPTFTAENPNMFILSLSQDMQLKDIYPSRLERTKFIIQDIANTLENGQFGLMVYSSEPYVITPFSDDVELIKNLLPQIVANIVPDNGDRLDRALDMAIERFINAGYKKGNIILFATDVGQYFDLALASAEKAKQLNFSVNVIDASFEGNEKLKILAQKGNGEYASVRNSTPQLVVNKLKTLETDDLKENKNKRSSYLDFGYYLVFIPLFCLLMFFRKGLLIAVLCFYSFSAQASFLKNPNQEGLSLFNKEQYNDAYNKFTDINWRGISLYKQNKFEEALNEIQNENTSLSLYNKGVILTKLCKYKEALEAFSQSIKINPENEDAKYNIEVLNNLYELSKNDPSVLNCDNNNQQQQNQNNEDNNNDNKDKSNDNNEDSSDDKNNQSNEENSDNKSQNKEKQQDESSQKRDSDEKKENNNNASKDNSSDKTNEQNNQQNSQNDVNDEKTKEEQKQESNQNNNKENQMNSQESSSEQSEDEGGQPVGSTVSESDEKKTLDEEAIALQRRYREIPDDVGGLLREFIKKDYMRNRYND